MTPNGCLEYPPAFPKAALRSSRVLLLTCLLWHLQFLKPHSTYSRSAYMAAHAPAPEPSPAVTYVTEYAINVADDRTYTASDGVVYMPDR
jgi:hypothetical protein